MRSTSDSGSSSPPHLPQHQLECSPPLLPSSPAGVCVCPPDWAANLALTYRGTQANPGKQHRGAIQVPRWMPASPTQIKPNIRRHDALSSVHVRARGGAGRSDRQHRLDNGPPLVLLKRYPTQCVG